MAYEVIMLYHLYMPLYFLGTYYGISLIRLLKIIAGRKEDKKDA